MSTGSTKRGWRSLEELADTPEFRKHLENEFPAHAEEFADPVSRRGFLGLMGAAVAMSGLAGCRRPLARILPYAKMPEDLLPGVPQTYATVLPFQGIGLGVLVESHEGRPVKIEGNPGHPGSLGATHVFAQASMLDLYDPERLKAPMQKGEPASWDGFERWVRPKLDAFRARGGEGLRFLCGSNASPTVAALRAEIQAAFPMAVWHTYEAVNRDQEIAGSRIAYGRPLRMQLALDQADRIVALDSDFLFAHPNAVRLARDFAKGRRVASTRDDMNRLYSVESAFTVTGGMADHRLRLHAGEIPAFALALASALSLYGVSGLAGLPAGRAPADEKGHAFLDALAKDLASHRGRSVLVAGASLPPAVHALVHLVNEALGAVGPIVRYTEETESPDQTASLKALAEAMDRGAVEMLFVIDGNPAYDAPADLGFAAKMEKVADRVRLSLHDDETAARSHWVLSGAHPLEAWGDARAWDGTLSVQQPLIAPLYEGKSEIELLLLLLGRSAPDGHETVRSVCRQAWGDMDFEARWRRAVHDGLVAGSAFPEVVASADLASVSRALGSLPQALEGMALVFRPSNTLWDGRYAGNAWLQELPDNMTKVVWDNAALMSPATARELNVEKNDLLRIESGGRSLEIAAYVLPGLPDRCLTIPLGHGRTRAGKVGTGTGFDAYALRASDGMHAVTGVSVAKASGTYRLVNTQDHQAMDFRPLVREASLEHWKEHPNFPEHMEEHPPLEDIYIDREYDFTKGTQWGMAIDLNTCINCNACVVACQSENNIAVVGKDQVARGREMHWIRVDRYFTGDPEEPESVHQPVPCMHCENAPCESVCPVGATSHTEDGLNQMVYNRCIGTRYCNNNCPYKVRRFNYFDWNKHMAESEKLAKNPDVTVRMRGVMEKCTYCVQRISRARIDAKVHGRELADGDVRTACQEVCPTESIVFGDVNDAKSRVSKKKAEERDYSLLAWVNAKPRTTYQAKIRNRNPELEGHA